MNPIFTWLGLGALSPFSVKPRDAGTTRQIILPTPAGGATGPISVEPDTFGGQVGKGIGKGLGTLVTVLTIGGIVVLVGPQLLGMFARSAVSATRG